MAPQALLQQVTRVAAATAMLLGLGALPASAASVSDGVATINVSDSHGGMNAYITGGVDHLYEADYYFRTGSMTSESVLTGTGSTYITSVTSSVNDITVTGSTSTFDFTLIYGLNGAGLLVPILDITNTSGALLNLTLFNYQDWDVNNTPGGDVVAWNGSNITVSQSSTTIGVLPFQTPNAVQATAYATLRNSLRNGTTTNLVNGSGLPFGPGDATFAFQFVLSLAPGESTTLAYAVPEPSSGLLGAMGLVMLGWASRRRRQRS